MVAFRVVVIGGYGFFGGRLVRLLARRPGSHVIVAGRSGASARAFVDRLRGDAAAELSSAVLDVHDPGLPGALRALAPDVVVHTSGPFQGQGYQVALACISIGAHYVDLADGREFVCGIRRLDEAAREAGCVVISGASSVPALSTAAADVLAQGCVRVQHVDIGINPGNQTERGLSTVRSILSYCGRPIPAIGGPATRGWVGSRHHDYPAPVGRRLLSPCDVPDLVLLPTRYPGQPTVAFGGGLELAWLHRGINLLALLARLGLVRDWSAYALPLKRMSDLFLTLGTDEGAMHVAVTGVSAAGEHRTRTWHLVATHGVGPYVPTLAAAACVRRLQRGEPGWVGARPCIGLLDLSDFAREAEGLQISMAEQVA